MGQLSLAMARPFITAVEETLGTMTQVKVRHVAVEAVAAVGVDSDIRPPLIIPDLPSMC